MPIGTDLRQPYLNRETIATAAEGLLTPCSYNEYGGAALSISMVGGTNNFLKDPLNANLAVSVTASTDYYLFCSFYCAYSLGIAQSKMRFRFARNGTMVGSHIKRRVASTAVSTDAESEEVSFSIMTPVVSSGTQTITIAAVPYASYTLYYGDYHLSVMALRRT